MSLSIVLRVVKKSDQRIARSVAVLMTGVVALMCTGCISLVDARLSHDGKAGWVVKRYTQDELRAHRPSCLAGLSDEEIQTNQYVQVSVNKAGGRRYVGALLPPTLVVVPEDYVEIAPYRCEQGQVPAVRQVLKPKR